MRYHEMRRHDDAVVMEVQQMIDATESLADAFYCCAHNEATSFALYNGSIYPLAERAVIAAIRETYGLSALKAKRVLDVMSDSGEYDVRPAVTYVRANRTSSAYQR